MRTWHGEGLLREDDGSTKSNHFAMVRNAILLAVRRLEHIGNPSRIIFFNVGAKAIEMRLIHILLVLCLLSGCDNGDSSYGSFAKACYAQASSVCNGKLNRHDDGYELHVCLDRFACACLRRNGIEGHMCSAPAGDYFR